MDVSQKLNHINEENYDDDITVTDVPKGWFLAVTANTINPGDSIRQMSVVLMELEQSDGGTMTTNSGLYIRQKGEEAVKATVTQNGKEVASNTTKY